MDWHMFSFFWSGKSPEPSLGGGSKAGCTLESQFVELPPSCNVTRLSGSGQAGSLYRDPTLPPFCKEGPPSPSSVCLVSDV